jgi:hypothetical protein
MSELKVDSLNEYHWTPQPQAANWVKLALDTAVSRLPWAREFASRLSEEAGCRLVDLIDCVFVHSDSERMKDAIAAGWKPTEDDAQYQTYEHAGGLFPTVASSLAFHIDEIWISLKVECVATYLAVHDLTTEIFGRPLAPYRYAIVESNPGKASFIVSERHGRRGFDPAGGPDPIDVLETHESFRTRRRDFHDEAEAFQVLDALIDNAVQRIGRDYACDRFFAAEREYWQKRNRAAQFQKARQDRLGIGWANHDHHTYRSSREHFKSLVAVWEKLGLFCRERFYAGIEAGWGAQVMEQPITRIITFNDVDLSPEELMGDFSHNGLLASSELKTIGLWCGLHGEAVSLAGMHHLEGTFDFLNLRDQMARDAGIRTMKPFTDFSYLKQAFTEGERWPVQEKRIKALLSKNLITLDQADMFRREGAIGSHLENLERNDGFKGFNQQGVSEIINATDPRRQAAAGAFETVSYKTIGS